MAIIKKLKQGNQNYPFFIGENTCKNAITPVYREPNREANNLFDPKRMDGSPSHLIINTDKIRKYFSYGMDIGGNFYDLNQQSSAKLYQGVSLYKENSYCYLTLNFNPFKMIDIALTTTAYTFNNINQYQTYTNFQFNPNIKIFPYLFIKEFLRLKPKDNSGPDIQTNTIKVIGCLNGEQVLEYQETDNSAKLIYDNTQITSLTNEEIFMYQSYLQLTNTCSDNITFNAIPSSYYATSRAFYIHVVYILKMPLTFYNEEIKDEQLSDEDSIEQFFNNIPKNYFHIVTQGVNQIDGADLLGAITANNGKYLITNPSENDLFILEDPTISNQNCYIWNGTQYILDDKNKYLYFTQSEIDSIFNPTS